MTSSFWSSVLMRRFVGLALVAGLSSASLALGQSKTAQRKPSPSLASLPAPKAGGALRILLVVDDWNRSNGSPIYRKLVEDAVGGDAKAWSAVVVQPNEHGPSAEKLRDFNVVVWYTGDLYGGGASGISTLSDQDEKTVRRYLQETGGAFILVSPGFLSTRGYGTTWTTSENPFLKDVAGFTGFVYLVQRFEAGTVRTPSGASFAVQAKGSVESQFTAVNPDGAAVVFSATLDPRKTTEGPVPVAVANAFGGGRFVYVGFSLENIAEPERAKAFGVVLEAATGARTAVAATPAPPVRTPVAVAQKPAAQMQTLKQAPPGPAVMSLSVSVSTPGDHRLYWKYADWTGNLANRPQSYEVFRRDPDGWRHLTTGSLAGGKGQQVDGYNDLSFRPVATAYRVATVYADGRRGEAEIEYPNPPQPRPATGFTASQVRWDGVRLQWDRMSAGVTGHRLYGPGLPASGYPIPRQNGFEHRLWRPQLWEHADPIAGTGNNYHLLVEIYKLTVGEHEFRVANEYGQAGLSPATAVKVRVSPQPPPGVTDLRVVQNGYRRITVHWKAAANTYNGKLYVHAAGMGGALGRAAVVRPGNDQWMEFREVPEGSHTIRMGYYFAHEDQPPLRAEVTTTVVNMTQTSNDIPNCPGTWVSAVCQSAASGGGKGKSSSGSGKGDGKLGKK